MKRIPVRIQYMILWIKFNCLSKECNGRLIIPSREGLVSLSFVFVSCHVWQRIFEKFAPQNFPPGIYYILPKYMHHQKLKFTLYIIKIIALSDEYFFVTFFLRMFCLTTGRWIWEKITYTGVKLRI